MPRRPHPPLRKIHGIFFDWDGTLLNSFAADSAAYLGMFAEMGIAWGLEDLSRHYSPNWYDVYRAAGLPESRWAAADLSWRSQYAKHRPQLMTGARPLLSTLRKDYLLGLVTSGDRDRVTRQLREFRLLRTFSGRVCGGDTLHRKPHPEPLQTAMRAMQLEPHDCVYVGDTREDVQMARSAGVRSIGIIGPFPTADTLKASRPDLFLASLRELPAAIQKMQA
jgi:pyrophosphatase PpaX